MDKISQFIKKEVNKNSDKKLIIWCIGSKCIVGDTLGPYVGTILKKSNIKKDIIIKGNLENPIHYLNIQKEINKLNKKYSKVYSIVVDSSLHSKLYIGRILMLKNKTILGSALDKKKYIIGDISVKGIVGEDYENPFKNIKVLEEVPKKLIKDMSYKIATQLLEVIK